MSSSELRSSLTIWGRKSSAATQKVLWCLDEAGIDEYNFFRVSGKRGPDSPLIENPNKFGVIDTSEYLAMNPNSTILTNQSDDVVLWESHTIIRYIAAKFAPQLYGTSPEGFARASMWMDWALGERGRAVDDAYVSLIDLVVRTPSEKRNLEKARDAYRNFIHACTILEERLGKTLYIAGDEFTMADIAIGVAVNRFYCCCQSAKDFGWDLGQENALPSIASYYTRLKQRDAFIRRVLECDMIALSRPLSGNI